jgi:hypothetical protein
MIKRTFLYSTLVYLLSMILTYLRNVGRNFGQLLPVTAIAVLFFSAQGNDKNLPPE